MDKRRVRGIRRILFAVGIVVKIAAIYGMVFSGLCVVNGGRWGMLLPFGISLAAWVMANELLEATEGRRK